MPTRGWPEAMLVAVLTAVVIAVPYRSSSYDRVSDDGIVGWLWLVEVALLVGTALASWVSRARLLVVMGSMLACVPLVVIGRVVIDLAADPTSHNLWPIEVVLAVAIGLPPVGLGALLGWAVRRVATRSR